jgi:AmmeMemoRadiSam system protein B
VVNHNHLADDLIDSTLAAAGDIHPRLILLVSPNHFQVGAAPILTTRRTWETPSGSVGTDEAVIDQLVATGRVKVDDEPFAKEHGVFNLLPFLMARFPGTQVVPIIVKDIVPIDEAIRAADAIGNLLPPETLIVGSFDFSHYVAEPQALEEDAASLTVLQALDPRRIDEVSVDSKPGLALTLELMRRGGADRFQLIARDSSANRFPNSNAEDNTSYVDGLFLGQEL